MCSIEIDLDAEDLAAVLDVDELFVAVGTLARCFVGGGVFLGRVGGDFVEHVLELLGLLGAAPFAQSLAHAFDGVGELVLVDRLHQVIDRIGLESADRVFFESGDEDEQRRLDLHHSLDHAEPVETGHLDVEEDEVGLFGLDRTDRLAPVGASADHLDIFEFFEPELEALDGELFVVDDQGTNGHAAVPIDRGAGRGALTGWASAGFAARAGSSFSAAS